MFEPTIKARCHENSVVGLYSHSTRADGRATRRADRQTELGQTELKQADRQYRLTFEMYTMPFFRRFIQTLYKF